MLVGSFLLTFILLTVVWMLAFGGSGTRGAGSEPTPSRSPYYTLAATPPPPTSTPPPPTPMPTPTRHPSASPSTVSTAAPSTAAPSADPLPSPVSTGFSPPPLRTALPSVIDLPSTTPGSTETYVVVGSAYVSSDVPSNGRLATNGDKAMLETTSTSSDALWVTYMLDPGQLPVGAVINSVDVAICGRGEGTFWEVYGPPGSEPHEYEVIQPEADGCWHFADAPTSDLSVLAGTMLDSRLLIERVEYTITFAQ